MKRKIIINSLLLILGIIGFIVCVCISYRDQRDIYGAFRLFLKLIPLYSFSTICTVIGIKELVKLA